MKSTKISTEPRFLSCEEVMARVGVSYRAIWIWVREGKFPAAREMIGNGNQIGWLESEVAEWMLNRPRRLPKGTKRLWQPQKESA